jgi:hypothetical protein
LARTVEDALIAAQQAATIVSLCVARSLIIPPRVVELTLISPLKKSSGEFPRSTRPLVV